MRTLAALKAEAHRRRVAATRIQRLFRGWRARRREPYFGQLRVFMAERRRFRDANATRIQVHGCNRPRDAP
jgi:hypothetical protein